MMPQQYCLRWKHHHANVQSMFAQLLEKERFCDVTLYCSSNFAQLADGGAVDAERGVSVRAHRVVLAACSELLGSLLGSHEGAGGEPVVVLDGAAPRHVRALLDYMYTGEMSVHHSELPSLLKTAEELRIKGLTDIRWSDKGSSDSHTAAVLSVPDSQKPAVLPDPPPYRDERPSLNGGPPPLIKLPVKERSPTMKRETISDSETQSPKRQRFLSGTEIHTDEEGRDGDTWKHGNMDISAQRVSPGGGGESSPRGCGGGGGGDSPSDDWDDATDIGSFLSTNLTVPEESSDESQPSSVGADLPTLKAELAHTLHGNMSRASLCQKVGGAASMGAVDSRFADVVKLNDYLRRGRRPQFWEEDYVKRVMEAVRLKELEMKQAAEILGVSYGTLYGRYRDVYGCINRPYRNARDFWSAKGPSEVLERLQRGEIPPDVAAAALGVSARDLVQHYSELHQPSEKDFEPIPIEIDPLLKSYPTPNVKSVRRPPPGGDRGRRGEDEDPPACVIDKRTAAPVVPITKWPRTTGATGVPPVSGTGEREASTSPALLMRTRPDLTIVAARKPDPSNTDDDSGPPT